MSSGYEIEKISETYRDILNILSSSSEDYFFFWDFETGKLEVMEDIGKNIQL